MKKLSAFAVVVFCVFLLYTVYSVTIMENISGNITRLHIIADSNLEKDQLIKLAVRDEILDFVRTSGMDDVTSLKNEADGYLDKIGAGYKAEVSKEDCFVPKKEYNSVVLPRGRYKCIKVILGNGKGENWWCIAYPPLCYTESMFGDLSESGMAELSKILDDNALDVIIKTKNVNFRFKIVDEIQELIEKYREFADKKIIKESVKNLAYI